MPPLVLASTSPYRRALLERLRLEFEQLAPGVDETPRAGEPPGKTAERLARAKAEAVAKLRPGAVVIGSDQVAVLDGRVLGKPGSREENVRQLEAASGRRVEFHTGVCVTHAASGRSWCDVVPYAVELRCVGLPRIEAYVDRERAFDCAGGFRCESLGPALFARMEGEDPTAVQGLPLIRLIEFLAEAGIDVLGS